MASQLWFISFTWSMNERVAPGLVQKGTRRSLTRSLDPTFQLAEVILVDDNANALGWLLTESHNLAGQEAKGGWCEGLQSQLEGEIAGQRVGRGRPESR